MQTPAGHPARGEHQVEDDKLDLRIERVSESGLAILLAGHLQAAAAKAALHEVDDPGFVLNHEDHGSIIAKARGGPGDFKSFLMSW